MAYIINTSTISATTLNLSQGRVMLKPLQYCELHDIDREKARQYYNSKELGLYVAETDEELNLILEGYKISEEVKTEETETIEEVEEIEEAEESTEKGEIETPSEEVNTPPEEAEEAENSSESPEEIETVEEIEEVAEEETEENEDALKAQAKEQVLIQVERIKAAADMESLRQLATSLGIPFMWNISLEKLACKIVDYLNS